MSEGISEFYARIEHTDAQLEKLYSKDEAYFNVLSRKCNFGTVNFSYRDFYKVTLIIGRGKLYYADKWIEIDRPALLFSNPLVPYAWESVDELQKGFFCIFNESFVNTDERKDSLVDSPLFKISGDKVFFLDEERYNAIDGIYHRMMEEINSDYSHKMDVLRCYLHLLIHEAMKMQPTNKYVAHRNASERIAEIFIELLERQFPANLPDNSLILKTPNEYANRLSVHVNHLNRAVKESTGKTTSELISERIVREATQLLLHTNYTVSEIAFGLGFDTPSYFTNFFRKHTGKSPGKVRKNLL